MTQEASIDFAIIGGGIIGLYLANELVKKYPQAEIALFEKSPFLGDQTSGRNSGVLHSGMYYKTGSLKHLLCIEGHEIWKKIDADILTCGKFIFAQNTSELDILHEIFQNAITNNVPQIKMASKEQIRELNRDTKAVDAIFSPWTSILDTPNYLKKLIHKSTDAGVMILPNHDIQVIEKNSIGFSLISQNERIRTKVLFNCAGLHSVRLRNFLGLTDLEDYWVKGHYLTTNQKLNSTSLLYPVPEPQLKGLGVHSTYDFANKLKFGPDTLEVNEINYRFSPDSVVRMKENIKRIFPTIDSHKLQEDYVGIRPKIKHHGKLYEDFWISKPLPDYIEALGIESPGITAAPAIVKRMLALI